VTCPVPDRDGLDPFEVFDTDDPGLVLAEVPLPDPDVVELLPVTEEELPWPCAPSPEPSTH
jgi:hypothetical protein